MKRFVSMVLAMAVMGCGMFTAPFVTGVPGNYGSGYQSDPGDETGGGMPPAPTTRIPPRAG